jgi:hypothetical protein
MAGFIARHWRFGALLSCAAFLALPLSNAGASTGPFSEVIVGPIAAAHGFKVDVTVDCNDHGSYGQLAVTKSGHHYTLSYNYDPRRGRKTTCTAAKKLGSGSMTVRWGKALSGKLKFGHAGSLKALYEKGCTGPLGHYRKLKGTGTLKMAIHSGVFGKLDVHSVHAEMQVYDGNPTCTGGGSGGNYTEFFANWDKFRRGVNAFRTPAGHRRVDVFAENDTPAVTGSMDDQFMGGSKLFSFKSDLSSAHVGSMSPLLTGGLTYTATGSCGSDHTTGTLKGKLVVHDPALGTMRFVGKKATKMYGGPSLESNGSGCTAP